MILFRDHIRPQALRQSWQRMRHRRDARRVGTVKLADKVENRRQARLIDGNLRWLQLEPRQEGDVFNLLACKRHENSVSVQ